MLEVFYSYHIPLGQITLIIRLFPTNPRREAKRAFLNQDEEPRKGFEGLKQFTLQRVCMSLEKKRNTNRSSHYLVSREICLGRALGLLPS